MDPPRSADRAVLEPFAELDPAELAGLPSSAPLSIRSLALSNSPGSHPLVHLGSGGGKLLLLSLNPARLLKSASISNRPIESIQALPEIDRILVLSDGSLFLLDPLLSQPIKKLSFVKDVSAVSKRMPSIGDATGLDPLGDAASRSEVLKPGQRLLHKLSSGIRANGTRPRVSEASREGGNSCYISVACGKKLVLIELFVSSGIDSESNYGGISVNFREILGVERVKTMVWIGDSIIVGTLDGYFLISICSGKSTLIFSLPESSGLPRLQPLRKSKEVLLLVDNVGVIVNALGQPVGGSLIFQYVPESVVELASFVVVGRDRRVDLYGRKTGSCVQSVSFMKSGSGPCILASDEQGSGEIVVAATPYKAICFHKISPEEQIKDLLRKKIFKEAICLVEELESEGEMTKEMLSFVHAQVGFLLLFDLHFEEAIDHFLLSEAMQPSEIFPFIMREPNRWSQLVPRNRYWGLHPPPVPLEQVVDDGLMAIQRTLFLRKAGVETTADEDFLLNPPSRSELLESAIQNIIRYLCLSRDKDLTPAVQEGVDTLLMYLYRALNCVGDMENLASSQNSCVVEELETLLDDSGHLRTLAFLYASKGMCSKALAIWRILARNYSTGLWKDTSASFNSDSVDNSTDLISGQRAAAAEATKLLQESSNQDVVLEHLGWIADIDQELAVIVLTSEKRVNQLSPEVLAAIDGKKIVLFAFKWFRLTDLSILTAEEVLAAIDGKKVEIRQRYLQWLIEDQDSDDTQFHTLYALSLAKSALEAVDMDGMSERLNVGRSNEIQISGIESERMDRNPIRERLQIFLQASDLYDPEEVLDLIEGSELWLEKAILYRKMGQETLVLQILALKLEDSEAAEQYCAEIGRNDAYMQLLNMYLDPQDGKPPMFKAAVRLLHNHGQSLNPLQVLEKLSPDMPLQIASDTILRMLRARIHHHRQGQIVHKLSQAMSLDARLARLEERTRHVQINDESMCDSCHSRLGTKLFAMYPDDSVVCYKCYRRQGESTSARGRNFMQDPIFKPGWLVSR